MNQPSVDLVVFGATSFVGKILCTYLIEQQKSGAKFTWAAAARSKTKLETLKHSLGEPALDLPLIVSDATDETALTLLCNSTRVVISTVGPYALYGDALIKACVTTGTDYCDLCGEVQWIRKMIDRHQEQALASGARIVNCCGFDSIPSDLGVSFLQQHALDKFSQPCVSVKLRVKAAKGGLSGGTFASMINASTEASKDPKVKEILANPYALCKNGDDISIRQHRISSAEFDQDYNCWVAPFVMAAINEPVVHRSNSLKHYAYGNNFAYNEAMMVAPGNRGRVAATLISWATRLFTLATAIGPLRRLLIKIMPAPGEGPSPEAQYKGYFDIRLVGRCEDGRTIHAKVTGDRDPGYGSTAKMLGQAGLSLIQEIDKSTTEGGFWTPASIFDDRFIHRLQKHAGISFELLE